MGKRCVQLAHGTLFFSHLSNSCMQSRLDIVLKPYFPMSNCIHFLPEAFQKNQRKYFFHILLCKVQINMVFPTSHLFMKKISVRAHCTYHCPCTCHRHHHHHLWAAQLCALYHESIDSSCILKTHDHSCTLCFQQTSYRPSLNT